MTSSPTSNRRNPPREHDERVLAAIRARMAGKTQRECAEVIRPGAYSCSQIYDVQRADIAESGEPEAVVREGYW